MKRILLLLTILNVFSFKLFSQVGTIHADPAIGPGQFYLGTSASAQAGTLKPETAYNVKVNVKNLINSGNIPAGGFTVVIQLGKGISFSSANLSSLSGNYIWSVDNTTDPTQTILQAVLNTTVNQFYNEDLSIPVTTKPTAFTNSILITAININGTIIGSGNETLNDDAATTYSVFSGKLNAQTNVLCNGSSTGSVSLSADGGTAPYQWKKDNGAFGTATNFSSLAAGDYVFTVKDANDFTDTVMITISEPAAILITQNTLLHIGKGSGTSCTGASTGFINVTATGGSGVFTYALDGSSTFQVNGIFAGLSAGAHTITAKDVNGCTKDFSFSVTDAPAAPTSGGNLTQCALVSVQTLTATATTTGGNSIVWYTAANGGTVVTSPTLSAVGTATYFAAAKNSTTGCESLTRTAVTLTINAAPAAPTSTGNISECAQSPIQALNANSAITAVGGHSVVWYSAATNGTVVTSPTLNAIGTVTYYAALKNNTTGCESNSRTAVTLTISARPTATISGTSAVCVGGAATLSIAVTGAGPWSGTLSDGTLFSGSTSPITVSVNPGATTTYTVATLSSGGCNALAADLNGAATVTINTVTAGTVAGQQTLCSGGDPAAFTTSVAATGSNLTYQWQSSIDGQNFTNINVNGTVQNYDVPAGLTQTTIFRRVVTSTLNGVACASTSNNVAIIINWVTGGTIGSNQTICTGGDPAAFTNTTSGDGTSITYQWQLSTDNISFQDIAAATSATYDAPAGVGQTTYYRRMAIATRNTVACIAYSNTITVTVNTTNGGTIGTNQTLCSGSNPAAFTQTTAASGNAGSTISYRWEKNEGSSWTTISGAALSTYDDNNNVTVSTQYRRIAIISLNGVACEAISNTVTVTVNNITAGTIGSNQTVCNGSTGLAAFTNTTAATGAGTITYKWEKSENGTTWTAISGETSATMTPAAITVSTQYRRIAVSTLNGVTCEAATTPVTISINTVTAGTIGAAQTICSGGTATTITSSVAGSGAGTISYRWEKNTGSGWTAIASSNTVTFTEAAAITVTTSYRRITISTLNSIACEAISNDVIITVNNITAGTISGDQTICSGSDPVAFTSSTAGASNNGGIITYRWESRADGFTWGPVPSATSATYDAPALATTTLYRRITTSTLNGVVCEAVSNVLTVTINNITAGTIGGNETICAGGDPAIINSVAAGTGSGVVTYTWESSTNGTTWTVVASQTGDSYDPPAPLNVVTSYRRIATSMLNGNTCTSISNVIVKGITVRPTAVISGTAAICSGGSTTISVALTGTAPWSFSVNGVSQVSVSASYTMTVSPTANTTYIVSGLTDASCAAQAADMTGSAVITINPQPQVTLVGSTNVICSGGSNGKLTVKGTSGTAPYQFKIDNGSLVSGNSTDEVTFNGLTAGLHSVVIIDSKGCTSTADFTVGGSTGTSADISIGVSTYLTSLPTSSSAVDFVISLSETGGLPAAGTKVYISNVDGYSLEKLTGTSLTLGAGNTFQLDNTRWSVSNSGGYTILELINVGDVIDCSGTVHLGIKLKRNGPPGGFFSITTIVSSVTGEVNLNNNKAVRKFTSL